MLGACQQVRDSSQDFSSEAEEPNPDPLEPMNRMFFSINYFLDKVLITPFATIYRDAIPSPVQKGFQNLLTNLNAPLDAINYALQGNGKQFVQACGHFFVNSVFGLLGVVDVLKESGIERRKTSFSDTLTVWGFKKGPYLVLPILGPSSFRGTIGTAGDWFMNPWYWAVQNRHRSHNKKGQQRNLLYSLYGIDLLDKRSQYLDISQDLEKTSLDLYASTRSLYLQRQDHIETNLQESSLPE